MVVCEQYVHPPLTLSVLHLSMLVVTPDLWIFLKNPDLLYHTQAHWDQILCCLFKNVYLILGTCALMRH